LKKPQALIGLLAALGTAIGVLVAIVGLPYGHMSYTAFANIYGPGGTPAPADVYGQILVSDPGANPACVAVAVCNVDVASTTTIDAAFVVTNGSASPVNVGQIQWDMLNDNQPLMNPSDCSASSGPAAAQSACPGFPAAGPDPTFRDQNPDLNQAALTGSYNCSAVPPSADLDGSAAASDSQLVCFSGADTAVNAGSSLVTGFTHYQDLAAAPGTANLSYGPVFINDSGSTPVLDCSSAQICYGATVNFLVPPTATATNTVPGTSTFTPTNTSSPTNTPTNTPTATNTNTPVPGAHMFKECEGNANNCDNSVPAGNLFLCAPNSAPYHGGFNAPQPGEKCSGPNEGDLVVTEKATGVVTNPASLGVGGYEFTVEYDKDVISSLNPCDVLFQPAGIVVAGTGGAGAARGPVDQVNASGCPGDPGAVNNGTCTFSLIQENLIHFGCATNGQVTGPSGNFDVATLDLIPNGDLSNDIFPGNNNGVLTVIKDNGCEIADTLGHPVSGSINGGLLPVCGDLAITVRILEGDLNLDCKVDVQDQQLIAFRYGSFFGSLLYSKWFDLEPALHDNDIDIKDLQKVFGRDGSTCQNPIPAQPPLPPPFPFS